MAGVEPDTPHPTIGLVTEVVSDDGLLEALGGQLRVVAVFEDEEFPLAV